MSLPVYVDSTWIYVKKNKYLAGLCNIKNVIAAGASTASAVIIKANVVVTTLRALIIVTRIPWTRQLSLATCLTYTAVTCSTNPFNPFNLQSHFLLWAVKRMNSDLIISTFFGLRWRGSPHGWHSSAIFLSLQFLKELHHLPFMLGFVIAQRIAVVIIYFN